jgi:predicted O-methyltransferase YrrM
MYTNLQLAKKYIQYYLGAFNSKGHGMHSPFVFSFIRYVLNNDGQYLPPPEIETVRKQLLTDVRVLEVEDLGAGSRKVRPSTRSVQQVAKNSLKSRKLAQMLYRLAAFYQPGQILELGTSLGLTTAYFSKAVADSKVSTIEGSRAVAAIAQENFKKLNCENIHLLTGNFDEILPVLLGRLDRVDLAFVDGNHRYDPTLDYFNRLLGKTHNNSILVFDDIHWSPEMEKAWEEIKAHPSVRYTIDIFFLGFVFFKEEFKVKQDFVIRF